MYIMKLILTTNTCIAIDGNNKIERKERRNCLHKLHSVFFFFFRMKNNKSLIFTFFGFEHFEAMNIVSRNLSKIYIGLVIGQVYPDGMHGLLLSHPLDLICPHFHFI